VLLDFSVRFFGQMVVCLHSYFILGDARYSPDRGVRIPEPNDSNY